MGIEILKNLLRFIILVLVQVTILNNIQLSVFVNPYLYVLFIILLPIKISKSMVMLIAFITGMVVGAFTDSVGYHAAACTFAAFVRPGVLRLLSPREGYDSETQPTIKDLGLGWFLTYAILIVFAHHCALFFIEVFRVSELLQTFLRVIFSTSFTVLLIVIAQYLSGKTKAAR